MTSLSLVRDCTVHRHIRALTFCCSVITANMVFLMCVSSGTPKSSSHQVERDPVISARIICFSNFLEWLVWPFDVPLAAAELQPQLSKGGKIRSTELTSCLLLLLQKSYLKKLSVDFCCCAELVNRVSFLEYLGHDPIPPTVPKPGSERFQLWVKNYFN